MYHRRRTSGQHWYCSMMRAFPTRTRPAASCRRRRPPGRARCSRPGSTYLHRRTAAVSKTRGGRTTREGTGPHISHLSNRARPQTHRQGTRSPPRGPRFPRGSSDQQDRSLHTHHPWRSARPDSLCTLSTLLLNQRGRPARRRRSRYAPRRPSSVRAEWPRSRARNTQSCRAALTTRSRRTRRPHHICRRTHLNLHVRGRFHRPAQTAESRRSSPR
mmetsp:Transcript_34/g.85  ORF Transcript_34/g.85 Transcript_34/m.85 type:complete len:216 (-) Transcript_34:656-1303(-)